MAAEKSILPTATLAVKKISALDSIRGLAAFAVVLGHSASFFPSISTGDPTTVRTHFDILIFQTPLSIFFSGGFAVILFFILSGFVLTLKYLSHKEDSLFPAAIKRYIRLMPIAFASILLGYVIMAFGQMYFGQLNQAAHLGVPIYPFMFEPHLFDAITQGLVGAFAFESTGTSAYNPVLWTIYYELLGAFIVFGLATMSRDQNKRWLLYAIAFIVFINTFFCAFILGLILADLYVTRHRVYAKIESLALGYKVSLLALALCIGSYQMGTTGNDRGILWHALTLFDNNLLLSGRLLQLSAGAIIIVLALSWVGFTRILEFRLFQWLGKISYALYAVHYILIFSLASGLLLLFDRYFTYQIAALLAIGVSLPVILGLAAIFHKYIEMPSIRAASRFGKWAAK